MPPKCDLDDCSLKGDIEEIKLNQVAMTKAHSEMLLSQAVFVEKVDGWMTNMQEAKEDNEKEHDLLFDRTRGAMKWTHFFMALGGISTFIGIIIALVKFGGSA